MFRQLFDSSITSITKAAAILGAASLLSRILGLLRDRLLTHQFGAGWELDAYYAAFRLPDFLYNLLILGALSAAFIPLFTKHLVEKKEERAWRFMNLSLSVLGSLFLALSVVCAVCAPFLTKIIAPGFTGEKMALTTMLTHIMMLSPVILGLSAVVGGALQSLRKFFLYALAPIFYNLGIIVGILVLVPLMGPVGLGWGVILGALLHLATQFPALWRAGFRPRWIYDWRDRDIRQLLRLMGPRTLALATTQINFVVITILASGLADGSVAVFNLANNIQWLPIGIIAVSYSVAAFPAMSEFAAAGNPDGLTKTISHTIRLILALLAPIVILLMLLRAEWVRLIFGSGRFDWNATIRTADTLALFAVGIIGQGLIPILARAFYAMKNTRVPTITGVATDVLCVILSLILMRHFGVAGLALAYSIASTLNAGALWILLRRELGDLQDETTLHTIFKLAVAGVLMALVMQGSKVLVGHFVDMTLFWGVFLKAAAVALLGMMAFLGTAMLLRVSEIQEVVESLRLRARRFVHPPPDVTDVDSVR